MGKTSRTKVSKSSRYLKRIVFFCIAFIVAYTLVSMYINYRLGIEISPTLTSCVYTFFGTELCAASLIKIVETIRRKEEKEEREEEERRQKELSE